MPHARATGARSLFPSACPLQLGQEMLLRLPFPIMVLMMGGSWERKTFSPFPLYRIPETPERVGEKKSFLFFLKNNDFHKNQCQEKIITTTTNNINTTNTNKTKMTNAIAIEKKHIIYELDLFVL